MTAETLIHTTPQPPVTGSRGHGTKSFDRGNFNDDKSDEIGKAEKQEENIEEKLYREEFYPSESRDPVTKAENPYSEPFSAVTGLENQSRDHSNESRDPVTETEPVLKILGNADRKTIDPNSLVGCCVRWNGMTVYVVAAAGGQGIESEDGID